MKCLSCGRIQIWIDLIFNLCISIEIKKMRYILDGLQLLFALLNLLVAAATALKLCRTSRLPFGFVMVSFTALYGLAGVFRVHQSSIEGA